MHAIHSIFELQQLIARFANCFDLKDWDGLGACLADQIHTDYSDLRGTPATMLTREQFIEMRRTALQALQTHHLTGNVEIELEGDTAKLKTSMVIFRRDSAGVTLNTHCLYFFEAQRYDPCWRISTIKQKVFIKDGQEKIHAGIVKI